MKGYINKIFSLEEKALAQVAINLCQSNSFKEVALNLEKPTYGIFLSDSPCPEPTFYATDPETLSIWAKVKDDRRLCKAFRKSRELGDGQHLMRWQAAVDDQCRGLTGGMSLPNPLKQRLRPWIKRIASEYLTYSRRQEVLFEVSRYLSMDILTVGDWNSDGRIDEEKVARRLLEDERPAPLQKYLIACVYCLKPHVERLWNGLPRRAKKFLIRGRHELYGDSHSLVSLWSRFMSGQLAECDLWAAAVTEAIRCGNRSALAVCWDGLEKPVQPQTVIDNALESLKHWQSAENYGEVEGALVRPLVPGGLRFIDDCTLPSSFSELTVFLLSQMDREQRVAFFEKAFQSFGGEESITKFLLDWPYQDDFLPTINQLWGVMPKDEFKHCMMALAEKYSGNANWDYDYRSLLRAIWEGAPEEYRSYVLCSRRAAWFMINEPETLLSQLVMKSPFQESDQELFKLIFRDQPRDKRREMMLTDSEEGELVCSRLIQGENWSFLNWLLKECMAAKEIASFKKCIIPSCVGSMLCMDLFENGRGTLVEDLFHWCLESEAEEERFKDDFITRNDCVYACVSLLIDGKFAIVENVIDFSTSLVEERIRLKSRFALKACAELLHNYTDDSWLEDSVWKQIDGIIVWGVDAEKKREFKKSLLSYAGIETHYKLVFVRKIQEKVERFYEWFGLTPEEIKELKWDTLFRTEALKDIEYDLLSSTGFLLPSLRWCLPDEKMVIRFIKEFQEYPGLTWEKKSLDELLCTLLKGVKKGAQDETKEVGVFVKDEGKRSVAVDEPGMKKRHKQV